MSVKGEVVTPPWFKNLYAFTVEEIVNQSDFEMKASACYYDAHIQSSKPIEQLHLPYGLMKSQGADDITIYKAADSSVTHFYSKLGAKFKP
ncbi:hypothetical protein K0504_06275 [Neiella marina]|uniref:Uncharacterized protein n=1 Tax=Neiella holothuriorum TaxID=2870530 RepID=A0ABS7EE71_9GAMM|nr:hypothetical protein [Neiella holothuriorum]MBW8190639.1 hypothetical protein [Neiella holothuriorum]